MAGVEAGGWVRGKLYERKAEKVRNAEEVEVWEKWRSRQELQARAWGKERVTKIGKTPSSALDALRFIAGAGGQEGAQTINGKCPGFSIPSRGWGSRCRHDSYLESFRARTQGSLVFILLE